MPPRNTQEGSSTQQTTYNRWTDSQQLRFLQLLYEARVNGRFESSKKGVRKAVFISFLPDLQERFPERTWEYAVLDKKENEFRNFWRVFLEAANRSGTKYHEQTGMLSMSVDNADLIRAKEPSRIANRVIRKPLLINDDVTFNTWSEIFAKDLPACHNILKAGDRAAAFAEAAERNRESQRSESPGFTLDDSSDIFDDAATLVTKSQLNERDNQDDSTPLTPVTPDLARTPTPARFAANPVRSGITKRKSNKLMSQFIAMMNSAFAAPQTKNHIITTATAKVPGQEEVEKALLDCRECIGLDRLTDMLKAMKWIKKDPMNAVMWNLLDSSLAKDAWIKSNFGDDLG
ncbi:hypothetical protein NOR_02872 [Metarhizium rileyi]|uniref:Myb/SANT-like domain-containing protein n=1 Tax=Metarhizium rileyi (strain RCEF 4871) TaxID=1649241 RepID=A0A167G3Q4_METRR|nr:hypothetical protein NOR_02872 [Metarhizium rileyi RCEF 4871]